MPVGTIQTITQAEYARRRGCTEGAVRRAVRDGRISLIDGRIDPVAADAQWLRNTRVRAGSRPAEDANLASARGSSGGRGRDDEADDYWTSKGRRERAEAELAELKLAEQRGELVRAADVRAQHAGRLAMLRESLLQLPARMAPLLAVEGDAARCHDILQRELHGVLELATQA
jgi:hypothetical protein